MPQLRITCPACKQSLVVRRQVRDAWLTCPNCLTQVMNPNVAVQTSAPAPAPAPEPESAQVDVEVRRDARATSVGLTVFLPLLGLGVLGFLGCGGIQVMQASAGAGLILLLLVAVVGVLTAGCIAGMTRTKSTESRVLYGLLGGVSVVAAVVIGGTVVGLLLLAAACSNCGRMLSPH